MSGNLLIFLPIVRCFGDESGVIPQNENDDKMSITHLGGIIPVEHLAEFLLLTEERVRVLR
jgi:hypothetical protein